MQERQNHGIRAFEEGHGFSIEKELKGGLLQERSRLLFFGGLNQENSRKKSIIKSYPELLASS